jgi:hypothetical protein
MPTATPNATATLSAFVGGVTTMKVRSIDTNDPETWMPTTKPDGAVANDAPQVYDAATGGDEPGVAC